MKREMTNGTLKALALLMSYPSENIVADYNEICGLLRREGWISPSILEGIERFIEGMAGRDLLDLQEDYVTLFDRTPSLSLHLFEHVHGDSRDRGQALVELDALYRERGLQNASEHTPDYLPMFLEYLSMLPVSEARENLDGAVDVIAVIGARLRKRNSPYAVLFDALQEAATRKPDSRKLQGALLVDAGAPVNAEQMDAAWAEQFAFDMASGAQNEGCPKAEEMLSRMGVSELKKENRT